MGSLLSTQSQKKVLPSPAATEILEDECGPTADSTHRHTYRTHMHMCMHTHIYTRFQNKHCMNHCMDSAWIMSPEARWWALGLTALPGRAQFPKRTGLSATREGRRNPRQAKTTEILIPKNVQLKHNYDINIITYLTEFILAVSNHHYQEISEIQPQEQAAILGLFRFPPFVILTWPCLLIPYSYS